MTDATRDVSGPHAIAARIRRLIASQNNPPIELVARRLDVSEIMLRTSIDEQAPDPALIVLAAVVREYGVDPTWLVTGEYDSQTHRLALESEDAGRTAVVNTVIAARNTPPSGTNVEEGPPS